MVIKWEVRKLHKVGTPGPHWETECSPMSPFPNSTNLSSFGPTFHYCNNALSGLFFHHFAVLAIHNISIYFAPWATHSTGVRARAREKGIQRR